MNERIKKLRKALDLTQQEFADRLHIKRGTMANYELGRNEPIDAVVSLICREFNVNEEWLRTGKGKMFIQQSKEDELSAFMNELLKEESADFRRRLVTALSRLKPEQWDALEAVVLELMKDPDNQKSVQPPAAEAPAPDAGLAEKVAALEKQNRELVARLEAMEKEDAEWEAQEAAARSTSPSQFR